MYLYWYHKVDHFYVDAHVKERRVGCPIAKRCQHKANCPLPEGGLIAHDCFHLFVCKGGEFFNEMFINRFNLVSYVILNILFIYISFVTKQG